MRITTWSGVAGRIVDQNSHLPVSGAKVFRSGAQFQNPNPPTTNITGEVTYYPCRIQDLLPPTLHEAEELSRPPIAITDTNGQFELPPERRWILYIVPMDIFPRLHTLVVRHDGYKPTMKFMVSRPAVVFTNFGEIEITQSDTNASSSEE